MHTLYTAPVSNFGARARLVILWKRLGDVCAVESPQALGGLKSPQYLALSPQGKMPLLLLPDKTALFESEVIVGYLLDVFAERGPSLVPATAALRARCALATRLHDVYLGSLQGCMYKAYERAGERARDLAELARQLSILEGVVDAAGPFVAGPQLSSADAALFPTFCFYEAMLPSKFGWPDVFSGRPRLARWFAALCADQHAAAVRADIRAALAQWEADGRWDKLGITAQVADKTHVWTH